MSDPSVEYSLYMIDKRNLKRFPDNFRFQLTKGELEEVVTNCDNPDRLTMKRRSDQMASRVDIMRTISKPSTTSKLFSLYLHG